LRGRELIRSLSLPDIPWHALLPAPVRIWWSQQSSRDQQAVKVLGLFLCLAGFYLLIWQPVHQQLTEQQAKSERLQARLEKAQLANYALFNKQGDNAYESFPDWLKGQLKAYRVSVISHQFNEGKTSILLLRYSQQNKASDFLQQIARRARITSFQVDQSKKEIRLNYKKK
jgi:hypothetical protein